MWLFLQKQFRKIRYTMSKNNANVNFDLWPLPSSFCSSLSTRWCRPAWEAPGSSQLLWRPTATSGTEQDRAVAQWILVEDRTASLAERKSNLNEHNTLPLIYIREYKHSTHSCCMESSSGPSDLLGALMWLWCGLKTKTRNSATSSPGPQKSNTRHNCWTAPLTLTWRLLLYVRPSYRKLQTQTPESDAVTGYRWAGPLAGCGTPSGLIHCTVGSGLKGLPVFTTHWSVALEPEWSSGGLDPTDGGGDQSERVTTETSSHSHQITISLALQVCGPWGSTGLAPS